MPAIEPLPRNSWAAKPRKGAEAFIIMATSSQGGKQGSRVARQQGSGLTVEANVWRSPDPSRACPVCAMQASSRLYTHRDDARALVVPPAGWCIGAGVLVGPRQPAAPHAVVPAGLCGDAGQACPLRRGGCQPCTPPCAGERLGLVRREGLLRAEARPRQHQVGVGVHEMSEEAGTEPACVVWRVCVAGCWATPNMASSTTLCSAASSSESAMLCLCLSEHWTYSAVSQARGLKCFRCLTCRIELLPLSDVSS